MRDQRSPSAFIASYDPGRQMYEGLTISDFDAAKVAIAADRATYLDALIASIGDTVPATGPINEARIEIMDFSSIPLGSEHQTARATYGNSAVKILVDQFWPVLMCSKDRAMVDLPRLKEAFVAEWQAIKARYNQSSSWQLKSN